ncbi:Phosphatidylinositol-4-phosphate 5-kinase [Tulasnella sp. 330]|nr:Phosphatidylinositol-4-phosphate 5-kinase [Tulasnella sp. 330]KAG8872658.1 Phosphatidylinositol-4-phosphate 5-kinase [Tulasnella sp. 331]KAG8885754.1 Phosphatidylinositol-4-phosphate 5-kinase [Tulasnella sp. 332]
MSPKQAASFTSNSVSSFQTAPLPANSAGSSSRDSFLSQRTISAIDGSRRPSRDPSPSATTPATTSGSPTAYLSPLSSTNDSGARRVSYDGKHLSLDKRGMDRGDANFSRPSARRPEPLTQTIDAPPSPPLSLTPTKEKKFLESVELYDEPSEQPRDAKLCISPEAMSSETLTATAISDAAAARQQQHPVVGDGSPKTPRLRPQRSPTLPIIPLSDANSFSSNGTISTSQQPDESIAGPSTIPSKGPIIPQNGPHLLHPPAAAVPISRPTRRNTTGSPMQPTTRPTRNLINAHQTHMSQQLSGPGPSSQGFPAYEDGAQGQLDSDILKEAEQIRAERRAKAQQEAEAAMTAPQSSRRSKAGSINQEGPLVGKIIGEDHVNYVLMYNMLTGIRVAVSRCQAKIRHSLTDDDYTARHKFSFDVIGNELTPSAKYDFKFKDYAPFVFRELREEYFCLDPSDYLVSLTDKYILSELGSPGKSGSFFYFSRDYRFIIKTIHYTEHKFLLRILRQYYEHVKTNPHTLISRFYGLHRVKLPHGRKIHFVIMNNLFPPHRDIHETYDLKGSTVGRLYPESKAATNPRAVLKDLNWINRGRVIELGPEKRALLTEQLRRDEEFLQSVDVMDYSLLIGIHNMKRGNRDNLRSNTLKVYSPGVPARRPVTSQGRDNRQAAIAARRAMRQSDPQSLGTTKTANLPDEDPEDNRRFIFYQDEGGYQATDESNEPLDTIYYFGVIDICTPFTFLKRLENMWKGLRNDRHKISPVPAKEYGERFFSFMQAVMRGGDGGEKFKEKSKEQDREKEE